MLSTKKDVFCTAKISHKLKTEDLAIPADIEHFVNTSIVISLQFVISTNFSKIKVIHLSVYLYLFGSKELTMCETQC